MRKTVFVGVALAVAVAVMVLLGSALSLDLESVALLGGALGAVIALVPDGSPAQRLGGFAAGLLLGWVGYIVRAALLPDIAAGRAIAAMLVVLACVAVTAATRQRLALWSVLLGAGAFAGAYEFTYNEAPPQLLTTSVSTFTTLFFNLAVGFMVAAFFAPMAEKDQERSPKHSGDPATDQPRRAKRNNTTMNDFLGAEAQ